MHSSPLQQNPENLVILCDSCTSLISTTNQVYLDDHNSPELQTPHYKAMECSAKEVMDFTWRLISSRDSTDLLIDLCEEACQKPDWPKYIEDCIIAGCDIEQVSHLSSLIGHFCQFTESVLRRRGYFHRNSFLSFQMSAEAKGKVKGFLQNGELPSIVARDTKRWHFDRLESCLYLGNELVFCRGLDVVLDNSAGAIYRYEKA